MARRWRIQYANMRGPITISLSRGKEGRETFCDTEDRKMLLETLGETCDRFDIEIYAFVLMTNHYHLSLQTRTATLSSAMQWFGVTYIRRFNNRHLRTGRLFQERFKSILVENDACVMAYVLLYYQKSPEGRKAD